MLNQLTNFDSEKNLAVLTKTLQNLEKVLTQKSAGTDIEILERNVLTEVGINFKSNYPLLEKVNVDLYLPDYIIVVECDGCHSHFCPICKPNQEYMYGLSKKEKNNRDRYRDMILRSAGYVVIRIWGHEIKANPYIILEKLKAVGVSW